jgi:protein TonB
MSLASAARFLAPRLRLASACALSLPSLVAQAQFASAPPALPPALQASQAETEKDYRKDAARHLYASYPMRIYRGRMPPLLYGVAIVETDVDGEGNIVNVRMKRAPAAGEVGPWIVQMIRKAGPFPPPAKLGAATYTDVWLVHKGGNFQLDTLTEGQD